MTDDQSYEAALSKLDALPSDDVRSPDMPTEEAVNEGEKVAQLLIEHADAFAKIGFDMAIAKQLQQAAGALRVADAKWLACWGEQKESRRLWSEKSPQGYALRDEMLAAFTYALRKDAAVLKQVRRIRAGRTHSDMIQDLRDITELGKKHAALLADININAGKLEQCAAMADELGTLYAKVFADGSDNEALDIRNRAFTWMRMLQQEVVDAAEYVLRDDPDTLRRFYSEYRRRQYRDNQEPATVETPAAA
ncbi:MAG: hypothetical protein GF398_01535 [Chitinivibrionales bacterium]|nr:hypothetical protein [Chitinivibrionales bacterium]